MHELHNEAIHTDHEQVLTRIAYDLFDEMYSICRKAARYAQFSVKIPLESLPSYPWIPTNCEDRVKHKLANLLMSEDLFGSYGGNIYELSWKKQYGRMPVLTTRDLIEAGYRVNEERYGTILRELKRAILDGDVREATLQAELLWVKSAFPLK